MSEETKHTPTPGPWEFVECGTANAMVRISDDCVVEGRYNGGQCDLLRHADARLIAAAPDLLAACEALCRRLEANGLVNRPDQPGNEYDQPAYDAARAAIAKAVMG